MRQSVDPYERRSVESVGKEPQLAATAAAPIIIMQQSTRQIGKSSFVT
jgi:hypothetical protein